MTDAERHMPIWTAALSLAATRPWKEITLPQIAAAAGLSLADISSCVSSKAEILRLFQRHNDQQFLASLETGPLEGEPHDRLFDAMLRRIELLTPHKAAIRNIAADPADSPIEWLIIACSAIDTQNWIVTAAGIDHYGMRGEVHKLGLAKIYRDVLKVWLDDDDPGLARTMASLDRKLRDAGAMARRLEVPLAFLSGLARAARAFRETRKQDRSASDATAD